ncbi:MAG TPA: glycosyl hydrolase family 18 protein [Tepidisphaeraceae bacterium]
MPKRKIDRRLYRPTFASVEGLESRQLLAFAGQIVGYLPDYEFSHFSQIDLTALTHINYFSIVANSSGGIGTTSVDGYSFASQLVPLVSAAHAAGVTVSITIDPSSAFQTIAGSTTATNTFITNILNFCSTYHLDGIDLDYEPGTLTTAQKNTWGSFLASLHAQTAAHGLTLSAAVQASQDIIPSADVNDLDWYYMMDYALEYNSSAPYSDSISYITTWSTTYGVPKSKLLMGVPFYGSSGTSWSNSTAETYAQILSGYAAANGGAYPAAGADSATISGTTWGFNGVTTMQNKVNYVIDNGYAGIMIWELGQDHFTAQGKYDQYSLLPAIKSAMTIPWLTASTGAAFSYNGSSLTLTSGTFTFTAAVPSNLALTVGSNASAIFNVSQSLSSLSIASGGKLDVQSNQITLPDSNVAQIAGYIAQGYNGGQWNGSGIFSSTAAADSRHVEGVGYYDNGTTLTVGYTTYGDANLDGVVNADDLSLIMRGQASGGTRWQDGNFNYDSQVNPDDWIKLMYAVAVTQQVSATNIVSNLAYSNASMTPFAQGPIYSNNVESDLLDSSPDIL